jgi:hypothetical protein
MISVFYPTAHTGDWPFTHQCPPAVAAAVGTVDPHRAVAANRALVASFFDRFLKNHNNHLLDGAASRYPITFVQ